MKHEIITMQDMQIIGISREIAFKAGPEECPKFWKEEYVEKIVRPVFMEGNIDFYKNAGFVVASTLGIHYHAEPKDAEVPYFLAQELIPGYLNGIEGTYHTPKGYYVAFENKEAFEAYEATFPKKEKKQRDGQLVDDCTKNPNE